MKSLKNKIKGIIKNTKREKKDDKMHFLTWYRPPVYDLEHEYEIHRIKLPGINTMPPFK